MLEDNFCTIGDTNCFRVILIRVLSFEIGGQLGDLLLAPLPESSLFFFFDFLIEQQLVVEVEVAFGNDLEERLSVEVDLVVVVISLVVDVGISESE